MAVFYSAHEPSKVEEGDSILHPTIRGCKEKYNVEINFFYHLPVFSQAARMFHITMNISYIL